MDINLPTSPHRSAIVPEGRRYEVFTVFAGAGGASVNAISIERIVLHPDK